MSGENGQETPEQTIAGQLREIRRLAACERTLADELRVVKARLKQTRDIMVGLHDALMGVARALPTPPPRITQAFMDGAARLRRDELPPVILGLDGRPVRRGDS